MDTVFIEGLEVDTVIGAYDWERGIRQCLQLDLTLGWDIRPAAENDELDKALGSRSGGRRKRSHHRPWWKKAARRMGLRRSGRS